MFRCAKFAIATVAIFLVGGFIFWGRSFPSYIKTSARAVQQSVKDQVPIEFELRRARDMIESILPELQGQIRVIAQEEVAIANLENDIAQSSARLASEQSTLSSLRDEMRVQKVSYRLNERSVSRKELTEQIARRFNRFKQGELTITSKQHLLDRRKENLNSALNALEAMKHRKVELEQKVEMLAAQAQSLKASQIQSGVQIDGSELSEADQLLSQIETRLAVAQRVLAFDQGVDQTTWSDEIVDEHQVLLEFDRYFDETETNDANRTMVAKKEQL